MAGVANRKERLDDELSCRLTVSQKERIQAAALKSGRRPSDFLRDAALLQAEKVLAEADALTAFGAFVGLVDVPTDTRPVESFADLLWRKHAPANRRPLP
jgi:uncharacterized protein (DUF1778 family)